ncbi:SPOR domain-containing protein [Clostridium estertheticum]|uniref:SPOR domain-containing protein n=1 Tax=Clostridium estertheticum TaxID=238834 RepID=UPI0013EED071|nr:SPOR domain-containing protein [Clostridium estertheticum]MBZ9608554.1 SPOR domain-containing protein [Clostridium estertheticum]
MRYTRYNYKTPRKNNNFMIVITLTLIAAIALGTMLSKLIPNNNVKTGTGDKTTKTDIVKDSKVNQDSKVNKESVDVSKVIPQTNIKDYVAIQCGVFSAKENALILKKSLMEFSTPFILEEDKLYKVLVGVYPKDRIGNIIKQLDAKKIMYTKINFQLSGKDSTSAQTNEMISADLKILNKLSEKDTKSIKTVELKKWIGSLKGAEEKSKNYSTMTEMKSYLTAMPAELKKEKTEEGYIYIYKYIKKILKK